MKRQIEACISPPSRQHHLQDWYSGFRGQNDNTLIEVAATKFPPSHDMFQFSVPSSTCFLNLSPVPAGRECSRYGFRARHVGTRHVFSAQCIATSTSSRIGVTIFTANNICGATSPHHQMSNTKAVFLQYSCVGGQVGSHKTASGLQQQVLAVGPTTP